ncbi:Probable calcium-binding protein CML23 [Striga hermonthica]|uniref:Probable calcium-binding protein CML23 n=1 Tax=Striga hermonthica TaxID=68872 RepID=A0A9N7NNF8_STRHE|nr:Probable calcium-binding protein CML23 [Striga hermonthica]
MSTKPQKFFASSPLASENTDPPNPALKWLFEEKDQDGDNTISFSELKDFLQEIFKSRTLQPNNNDNTTAAIMKEFDIDNDEKITMDEFVSGMSKWLDDTKNTINKKYSVKSLKGLYQILKSWVQKKREEREMMKHLIRFKFDTSSTSHGLTRFTFCSKSISSHATCTNQ